MSTILTPPLQWLLEPTRFITRLGRAAAYVQLSAPRSRLLVAVHRVEARRAVAHHLAQAARSMRFPPMLFHLQVWMTSVAGEPSMTQVHQAHRRDRWSIRQVLPRMTMRESFT